jgi:calcineurin-like phosphoesterase family protein
MSSIVRFISDPHFGHTNMATKRGFDTAEEMNEHIITEWNKVVRKRDITYILGDITMEKKLGYQWLDKLKGTKHVVLGNHDRKQDVLELLKYVSSVAGVIKFKKEFLLTHVPVHINQVRKHINIHGHVHENTIVTYEWDYIENCDIAVPNPRYFNVSMEVLDYKPHTINELKKKYL